MPTTKELIHAEIDKIRDEDLDQLYRVIRRFADERAVGAGKPGALSRLKKIKIRAAEDFSANLDLYLSGEKDVAPDQDVH